MPPPPPSAPARRPSSGDGALPLGREGASVRPRRIALFTGNYHHIADGVSLTLNRLVRHLDARGDAVLVFGPTVARPPMAHAGTLVGVPSVPVPGRPEYRFTTAFTSEACERLEAFRPDLVHLATPDWLGYKAMRWAEARGLPTVASYHTHFPSYLQYYRLDWMEGALWRYLRWFYNRCRQVYVPSRSMSEGLRAHGVTADLRLWARGVETDRFTPSRRSEAWRAAQGFAPGEPVVAFVGRLVWEKGPDVFADVVEGLAARGIAAGSLVVGDGPAREELAARLPQTVFAGHLGGTDLAAAYASSDVFVFPSDTETFGNVTLEAMASGLPTVCADATGSRGLVVPGETGFLCPPRDAAAFLDATARLVTDAGLRARMGAAARREAEAYSWPAILDRLSGYYDEVLGTRAAPEPVLVASHRPVQP